MHARKRLWRTWEESFRALIAYKKRHGDCNVPQRYHHDLALAQWVRKQRKNRFTELTQEQRNRLDELSFDWETLEERLEHQWNENLRKLKAYQQENLDCCVPSHYRQDPELGAWVATQQTWYARGRIRPDRQKKLESIGFAWSKPRETPRDFSEANKRWLANYSKLVNISKEHGHCIIPNGYESDESLCHWIDAQHACHAQNILPAHRKALLDEIGFVWRMDKAAAHASLSQRQQSDEMCERRVQFKEANSIRHPRRGVRKIFKKLEPRDRMLNQRAECKKERLEPRQARRLSAIGCAFICINPYEESKVTDPGDDAAGCISIWRKFNVRSKFVDPKDESVEARDEKEAAEIEYSGAKGSGSSDEE